MALRTIMNIKDEMLHLNGTQYMLRLLASGSEGEEWKEVAQECELEAFEMFYSAVQQEKEWINYLFKDGSMLGLNTEILTDYLEHITDLRLMGVGLPAMFGNKPNPIQWIDSHLKSDQVQVAPQETEIKSYLVGQVDATINQDELAEMEI